MAVNEPAATAFLLTLFGAFLALSALLSRAAGRLGLPFQVLFIGVGIAAGSEGLGRIPFDDYAFTFRLGTVALVLILFDGGFNTSWKSVRPSLKPAALLATFGVLLTAGLLALWAYALGIPLLHALLLGAVVSSTDAATVFSVLRSSGVSLRKRVGATLELESGLNDPLAVMLTLSLTQLALSGSGDPWAMGLGFLLQIAVGAAAGFGIGWLGCELLRRVPLPAGGLYPVLTLSFALLAFGLPTLFNGSGFLAVYIAAIMLGNQSIRYRPALVRVHDALAWVAQVGMFVLFGLLVFPSELRTVAPTGLALGLLLALVARPLAVALCLLPFRFSLREGAYIGLVGLRGAVPIVLATFPVLMGVAEARPVFHLVFFIVAVNAVIPGAFVGPLARWLRLETQEPPPPPALLEITSTQLVDGEVASFHINAASAAAGATLSDLPFPPTAVASLVMRGTELIPPRGATQLLPGDYLYVVCKRDDLPLLQLLLGRSGADD